MDEAFSESALASEAPMTRDRTDIPVVLEVPEAWFSNKWDGPRHCKMFAGLSSTLARRRVAVTLSTVGWRSDLVPRVAPTGGAVFSFHSIGESADVWRIKETSLVGWYSFDRFGFSGWSSIARYPEQHTAGIDARDANEAIARVAALRNGLRAANLSKYTQSGEAFAVSKPYVYFPMQLLEDPVAQFCRLDPLTVLRAAAELADKTGKLLVVKRHPLCRNAAVAKAFSEVVGRYRNVMISEASVHQHLAGCNAVIVANSGVGLEALLYGKPVFAFAKSEYELATTPISRLDQLADAFADRVPVDDSLQAKFVSYYLDNFCFHIDDQSSIDRCIDRALGHLLPSQVSLVRATADPSSVRPDEVQMLRSALAAKDAAVGQLEKIAKTALDTAAALEAELRAGGQKGDFESSLVLQQNGIAARANEKSFRALALQAFTHCADLAVLLHRDQKLQPSVEAELLRSGYAAGMDTTLLRRNVAALDYQRLHNGDAGYQANNWLVDHRHVLASARPKKIVEVGCGNGRFLKAIASAVTEVVGVDWAKSPLLVDMPVNVCFHQANVLDDALPESDICCSADVLEHFEPHALPDLLRKLHLSAKVNYHVIACYDDGHSHCAVLNPGQWLGLFKLVDPSYELAAVTPRRGRTDQVVCVITNLENATNLLSTDGIVGTWMTDTGQEVGFGEDYQVKIGGEPVASWFALSDGSISVAWEQAKKLDMVRVVDGGAAMEIRTGDGHTHTVKRAN